MGIGDKFKNFGHKIKEKTKNYNANRVIANEEKEQVRKICAMLKLKHLKELCIYVGNEPPKFKTISEEYGRPDPKNFNMRKTRMVKKHIPQTHELFADHVTKKFSKNTVVTFCEQRGLRISRELRKDVVSFQRSLEQKFENGTINDFENVISQLGWDLNDFDTMEQLKKRIWKQIHDGNISEDEVLQYSSNHQKNKFYSTEFEDILDSIESKFDVRKFSVEEDVHSQLEIFIDAMFPEISVQRGYRFKNEFGTLGEIELMLDGKFGIEVKVPESNIDLRNMKSQLESEQRYAAEQVAALIVDTKLINSESIERAANEFQNVLGIRTIIKKGHKKGT
tara:strand:- start:87 stop:1094 length:1008 start_codon:yes stop_codon:yes gene_type:complete